MRLPPSRAAKAGARSLLVGADYMPQALRRTITEALGGEAAAIDATPQVWSQMRRKSRHELSAIDAAMKTIGAARTAMREALASGAGVTEVVLAGERAAGAAGAQDVRTLFSLDGGRTLRPFVAQTKQVTDPLLAYLAVRRFNYWAECFPMFTTRPQPNGLIEAAWDAWDRPGRRSSPVLPPRSGESIAAAIAAFPGPSGDRARLRATHGPRPGRAALHRCRRDLRGGRGLLAARRRHRRIAGVICSCMFVLDADGIVGFDDGLSA